MRKRSDRTGEERTERYRGGAADPEPQINDVRTAVLGAEADALAVALVTRHRSSVRGASASATVDPAGSVRAALDLLAGEDGSIDPALWSVVRQYWRHGQSPFGDIVH